MNILITCGGTSVPIDNVRSITNFSSGRLGINLAQSFVSDQDWNTHFTNSRVSLFCSNFAFNAYKEQVSQVQNHRRSAVHSFTTYDEYAIGLEKIINSYKFDAIILAAAVSDYTCDPVDGKLSSNDEIMLTLRPTEKIISKIRGWEHDAMLAGFKLTSGDDVSTLLSKMSDSIRKNDCDCVFGNDINSIRQGFDGLIAMDKKGTCTFHSRDTLKDYIIHQINVKKNENLTRKNAER